MSGMALLDRGYTLSEAHELWRRHAGGADQLQCDDDADSDGHGDVGGRSDESDQG